MREYREKSAQHNYRATKRKRQQSNDTPFYIPFSSLYPFHHYNLKLCYLLGSKQTSIEDDNTTNLAELTPISSNQHVKKAIQNFAITTVDSSVSVSLKTLTEQQATMSSNIDKLINTSCNQQSNLTSILTHNVNVEQTSRSISSTSSQEQSLVVKTRHKETRKRHHHEVSILEDSNDSDGNHTPTLKSPNVNSHHSCMQLAALAHRDDDKVSIPDEEEMNRNLRVLQWESNNNNNNSGKKWN